MNISNLKNMLVLAQKAETEQNYILADIHMNRYSFYLNELNHIEDDLPTYVISEINTIKEYIKNLAFRFQDVNLSQLGQSITVDTSKNILYNNLVKLYNEISHSMDMHRRGMNPKTDFQLGKFIQEKISAALKMLDNHTPHTASLDGVMMRTAQEVKEFDNKAQGLLREIESATIVFLRNVQKDDMEYAQKLNITINRLSPNVDRKSFVAAAFDLQHLLVKYMQLSMQKDTKPNEKILLYSVEASKIYFKLRDLLKYLGVNIL